MTTVRGIISPFLCFIIVTVFAGCAAQNTNVNSGIYYPVIPSGKTLTDAVNALVDIIADRGVVYVDLSQEQGVVLAAKCSVSNNKVDFFGKNNGQLIASFYFYDLMGQTVVVESGRKGPRIIALPGLIRLQFGESEDAKKVADALYFIQLEVKGYRDRLEKQLAELEPLAAQYRALNVKPQITEEQRKLIVQANTLTQQKEYFKARDKYREAMAFDPTSYPAAYYNLALLDAQMNLPFSAILYMKHYLLLAPDAADARSAQDKIYEWELMLPSERLAGVTPRHTRGYLGAGVQSPAEGLAADSGQQTAKGALVVEVVAGSPALRGGLEAGDIIRTFDGNEIETVTDLLSTVAATPVGKTVEVGIRRGGTDQILAVTIVDTPE